MSIKAFAEELEKIAASVDELQTAARRLGVLRVPTKAGKGMLAEAASTGGGAAFIPNVHGAKAMMTSGAEKYLTRYMGHMMSPGELEVAKADARKTIHERLQGSEGKFFRRYKGTAVRSKGDFAEKTYGRYSLGPMPTPEGKKAINLVQPIHEGFERKAMGKPKDLAPGYGHLSPKVIMDERNLFQKMTGPGSAEALNFHHTVRGLHGEARNLHDIIMKHYGPRGADFVDQHGYSKAMKKDILRKVREGKSQWG